LSHHSLKPKPSFFLRASKCHDISHRARRTRVNKAERTSHQIGVNNQKIRLTLWQQRLRMTSKVEAVIIHTYRKVTQRELLNSSGIKLAALNCGFCVFCGGDFLFLNRHHHVVKGFLVGPEGKHAVAQFASSHDV
jgi:hypothetical protein